jgi:hypothetical protein
VSAPVPETESLPCPTCGAALPVAVGVTEIDCAHCCARVAVPPALQARLISHATHVGAKRADEARHAEVAAAHRHAARTNVGTLLATLIFACEVPAWIIAYSSGTAADLGPVGYTVAIAATAAPLAVLFGAFRGMARRRRSPLAAASVGGTCPHCGGPLEIEETRGLARCAHCKAASAGRDDQLGALQHLASGRAESAAREADAATEANFQSLDGVNRVLNWLIDGPMGFAAFFSLTIFVVGAVLLVSLAPSRDPEMPRVVLIIAGTIGGLGLLGLVWGAIEALQRALWGRVLRRATPRAKPRWADLREALAWTFPAAVCAFLGFSAMGAPMFFNDDPSGTGWMFVGLGLSFALLALAVGFARVLWMLLRWAYVAARARFGRG